MNAEAMVAVAGSQNEPKEHMLVPEQVRKEASKRVIYEKRPVKDMAGKPVAGLFNAWITLDNPTQFNSYTTDMVKAVILAFREASAARDVVAVVFTGSGDKAFCTGGNTKEYAEYYAGNPQEYRGYMRLFNDMVSAILACDKPVICRINGMRIGGGQEIGMACDFSIAQDLARFGQAGPKHGSAPIGGATDFLPVMIGAERAMAACVLCEPFSAHEAFFIGVITDIVPALKVDGKFIANPLVETSRFVDEYGRFVFGKPKTGDALKAGQELLKRGKIDRAPDWCRSTAFNKVGHEPTPQIVQETPRITAVQQTVIQHLNHYHRRGKRERKLRRHHQRNARFMQRMSNAGARADNE